MSLLVGAFVGCLVRVKDHDRRPSAFGDFVLVADGGLDPGNAGGNLDEPRQNGFAFVHQSPCIRIRRTSASFSMRLLMRQVVPASASCPSTKVVQTRCRVGHKRGLAGFVGLAGDADGLSITTIS